MTAVESSEGERLDREITIFTRNPDDSYRRVEEHHVLRLFEPEHTRRLLTDAGFAVDLLGDYRSPPEVVDLPGWYVVAAHKPDANL
jgi:hypothetical protein